MKFDSSALPSMPTQQELNELGDMLLSATELYRAYATLESHPRITSSTKSLEIFTSCREQLQEVIALIQTQLELLSTFARYKSGVASEDTGEKPAMFAHVGGTEGYPSFLSIPDVEPTDIKNSVFEIMRKCFQTED